MFVKGSVSLDETMGVYLHAVPPRPRFLPPASGNAFSRRLQPHDIYAQCALQSARFSTPAANNSVHVHFDPFFAHLAPNYRALPNPSPNLLTPCLPTTSFSNYTTADWVRFVISQTRILALTQMLYASGAQAFYLDFEVQAGHLYWFGQSTWPFPPDPSDPTPPVRPSDDLSSELSQSHAMMELWIDPMHPGWHNGSVRTRGWGDWESHGFDGKYDAPWNPHATQLIVVEPNVFVVGESIQLRIRGGFPREITDFDLYLQVGEDVFVPLLDPATGPIVDADTGEILYDCNGNKLGDVQWGVIEEDPYNADRWRTIIARVTIPEKTPGGGDFPIGKHTLIFSYTGENEQTFTLKDAVKVVKLQFVNGSGIRQDIIYPIDAEFIKLAGELKDMQNPPWPLTWFRDWILFLLDLNKVYVMVQDPTLTDESIQVELKSLGLLGGVLETIPNLTLNSQGNGIYKSGAIIAYKAEKDKGLTDQDKAHFPEYTFVDPIQLVAHWKDTGAEVTDPAFQLYLDEPSNGSVNFKANEIAADDMDSYLPGTNLHGGTGAIGFDNNGVFRPQVIYLRIPFADVDSADLFFSLRDQQGNQTCSTLPGYATNATCSGVAENDFSFSKTSDVLQKEVTHKPPMGDLPDGYKDGVFTVTLYCKDYGGSCTVRVEGDIYVKTKGGGTRKLTIEKTKTPFMIPVDKDKDGMADVWEKTQVGGLLSNPAYSTWIANLQHTPGITDINATDDFEYVCGLHTQPSPDGFITFDEYRGFVITGGEHVRTNLFQRDVFTYVPANSGIDPVLAERFAVPDGVIAPYALGLKVRSLDQGQFCSDGYWTATDYGWVNFSTKPEYQNDMYRQNCVVYLTFTGTPKDHLPEVPDFGPHASATDLARIVGKNKMCVSAGVPRNSIIAVFMGNYLSYGIDDQHTQWRKNVPSHELGHAMRIWHGSGPGLDHGVGCLMNAQGWMQPLAEWVLCTVCTDETLLK